ncbi:hypothetical protein CAUPRSCDRAFT_11981 [Caulochytrium protostelioides]|uniref:Uncharacterized protein n=1 Tax=Caulochytrium protostelioides TaxID=1555241 RepID=A0A4V1ITA0_9FUNG|nr:hypothetical protein CAUPRSCDRAFT_11981 [Caulochytrium protostelioides]
MNGESTASAKPMWRGLLPGAAIHPEVLSRSIAGLPPALRAVAWTPDHLWALLAYLDALSQANDEAILGTQETGVPLSADPTRPEPTAEDIAMCASPLAPASTLLYFLDRCRQAGFRRRFLFHLGDVLVPVTCTPHELLRRRERVWRCVVALVTRCRINRQKVREAASAAAAASAGGVEATMTDVTAKSSTVMPTPNLTSSSPSSTARNRTDFERAAPNADGVPAALLDRGAQLAPHP